MRRVSSLRSDTTPHSLCPVSPHSTRRSQNFTSRVIIYSDTISSASSEDYDEGDDNDEYNVSCEEDDKGLEDDHEEESTKPWLSLLRGYFAMVSSSFDTKRIQSIDAGKDATSLVSRLVTELDRILHPDFFATFLRDTLL